MNSETTTLPVETIDRKEFMKQVGMSVGGILLLSCLGACTETEIPDPMPGGGGDKVDFTLNLASNASLAKPGGFAINRTDNVIVAQTLAGDFIAVQSKCTHEGTELQYQANNKLFFCNNHSSRFNEQGGIINGPSTGASITALKKYKTSFDATGNTLRIFE